MVGAVLVRPLRLRLPTATDDAYLAQLRALGFTWPAGEDTDIIRVGHAIYVDRLNHWTPDRIAQDVHANLDSKGVTFGQVTSMVSLAESTYCPS